MYPESGFIPVAAMYCFFHSFELDIIEFSMWHLIMVFVYIWINLNTVVNYIAINDKDYKNSLGTIATHFLAFSLSLLSLFNWQHLCCFCSRGVKHFTAINVNQRWLWDHNTNLTLGWHVLGQNVLIEMYVEIFNNVCQEACILSRKCLKWKFKKKSKISFYCN